MVEITLTDGEKLDLQRRRLGLNTRQMAARFGIHKNTFCRMVQKPKVELIEVPDIQPKDHEACYVLRKRRGWTQLECALMMGVSRVWYNKMELGLSSSETLVKFWESSFE